MARVKHKYFGKHLPFEAFLTNPSPLWLYTKDRGFTESGQVYLGDSPPDWATRLRLGMDATSEMIGTRYEHDGDRINYHHSGLRGPVWGHEWTARGYADPGKQYLQSPGLSPIARADDRASQKIVERYKETVQTFAGLNFAAEVVETITLFTSPLKGMLNKTIGFARQVGSIKKYALRKPTVYSEKLGKLWLTWKFGIEPLAQDLAAAGWAATQILNDDYRRETIGINGRGIASEKVDIGISRRYDAYAPYAEQEISARLESQVRYRAKVRPHVGVPGDWAAIGGFELSDIVPAIWEAIPFSFLIDYFTNCNAVFSRVSYGTATPYLAYITKGVKNTFEVKGSAYRFRTEHPDVVDGYISGSCGGGSFSTRRVEVHRSSGVELPPVTLNFKVPGTTQTLNVAALIAAVRNSKP